MFSKSLSHPAPRFLAFYFKRSRSNWLSFLLLPSYCGLVIPSYNLEVRSQLSLRHMAPVECLAVTDLHIIRPSLLILDVPSSLHYRATWWSARATQASGSAKPRRTALWLMNIYRAIHAPTIYFTRHTLCKRHSHSFLKSCDYGALPG